MHFVILFVVLISNGHSQTVQIYFKDMSECMRNKAVVSEISMHSDGYVSMAADCQQVDIEEQGE